MVTSDLGACEWFVWDLRRSGLIDRGQLDSIVSEFLKRNPRAEAPALAEFLVGQSTITPFQAERVLNGKSAGLVLGPYVLLDAIGSGSMGQVYKASSKNDSTLYAVKVLPRRSMWNVRLARRQVRSFSNFSHPAVIPFMDVGTAGGLHYLVWPLVDGTTLEGLVQRMGKLPPNQAALYGVQVAQGLTVAHQNNLFHGLVKPSNIMVGGDNQARVLDFGIGSLLVENEGESLVDTMSTANTLTSGLDCTAPESIMEPTNRTPAGDQYSLGCTLYYCLTGRVPFPEGSAVEKMMAHQTKEPMDIRELAPDVPEGLCAVVRKLMAKTPEERFTGCDEVVESLEPYLGDVGQMPGGLPAGAGKSGSGRVPAGGLRRSGHRMPGLPSNPSPSSHGSRPGSAHVPGSSQGSAHGSNHGSNNGTRPLPPGVKMNPPPASHPGAKLPAAKAAPQPTGPSARTPAPSRGGPSIPSRATFQLPPMADELETGPMAATATPVESPRANRQAQAQEAGWADEEPARKGGGGGGGGGFGTIALVIAALALMIAVYFGATMLMR